MFRVADEVANFRVADHSSGILLWSLPASVVLPQPAELHGEDLYSQAISPAKQRVC